MIRKNWPGPAFVKPDRRDKLAHEAGRISEVFEQHFAGSTMPGLSFAIVVDDAIVCASGLGLRELASAEAPNVDTVYRIASMTKSFTAAAVMLLRDRGALRLDEAALSYLPEMSEFSETTKDSAPITVRDLMTMSSGWPQDDPWADRQLYRDDESMLRLYAQGVSAANPPGLTFEYSNLAYMLLGRLVTRVSGIDSMTFINQELLAPLGMHASCWNESDVAPTRLAPGYRYEDDMWKEEPRLASGGDVAAFAGLFSSTGDLARWAAMFMDAYPPRDDAETSPLKRASLREMQGVHRVHRHERLPHHVHERATTRSSGYGYGLLMRDDGENWSAGHSGGVPGYGSHMRWLPEHGVGVIALANVTYAALESACADALQLIGRDLLNAPRRAQASSALLVAQDGVNRLLNEWDDDVARDLFADNFFLDKDVEHWQSELAQVRATLGDFEPDGGRLSPHNWLRGQWRRPAQWGWCHIWITMAPTVPPQIQLLRLTPNRFPSELLQRTAESVAALVGCADQQALAELLADDAPREQVRRAMWAASARLGAATLGGYIAGDGHAKGRWHLHGRHGDLLLELVMNGAERPSDIRFIAV